jgi:hypothetical protein
MPRPKKQSDLWGRWLCSKCEDWKPAEEFYSHPSASNGLMSQCKECCRAKFRNQTASAVEKNQRQLRREYWSKMAQGIFAYNRLVIMYVEEGSEVPKPPFQLYDWLVKEHETYKDVLGMEDLREIRPDWYDQ